MAKLRRNASRAHPATGARFRFQPFVATPRRIKTHQRFNPDASPLHEQREYYGTSAVAGSLFKDGRNRGKAHLPAFSGRPRPSGCDMFSHGLEVLASWPFLLRCGKAVPVRAGTDRTVI